MPESLALVRLDRHRFDPASHQVLYCDENVFDELYANETCGKEIVDSMNCRESFSATL